MFTSAERIALSNIQSNKFKIIDCTSRTNRVYLSPKLNIILSRLISINSRVCVSSVRPYINYITTWNLWHSNFRNIILKRARKVESKSPFVVVAPCFEKGYFFPNTCQNHPINITRKSQWTMQSANLNYNWLCLLHVKMKIVVFGKH